jgi:hypothetical protein
MRVACQICQADGAANLLFLLTCERYPEVPAVNGIIDYAEEGALQALLCERGGRTDLGSGLRGASHPPSGAPQFSDGQKARPHANLFDFDFCAGRFDLLLDIFGFLLGDTFLDRLWCAFDKRFGFS